MTLRAATALACALVALAAGTPPAHAASDTDRFRAATALVAQERYSEAADALVALADDAPAGVHADDALFTAGQLYEERLGDPVRALELYERITSTHPHSRTALAASRRARALRAELGSEPGAAQAVAAFADIRHRYAERDPAESIERMETLLREHRGWPGEPRAVLWLASVHERERRLEAAASRYREVVERWPTSPSAFDAHRGAARIAIERERFADAVQHIDALTAGDGIARQRAASEMNASLALARTRARAYSTSFGALGAVAIFLLVSLRLGAGSWRASTRALLRPPTEAIYFAPVGAVLIAAALTGHEDIAPATALIVLGGFAVTWLSGAALTVAPTRWRAVSHAAAAALAIAAIIYIALHRTRLIDLILQTVRFGPAH
jgi:TolA-binding protein